jgi:hypothetical protein
MKKKYLAIQLPDNDELIQWLLKHFKEPEYKRYYYSNYFLYELKDIYNLKLFYLTSKVTIRKNKNEYILITGEDVKHFTPEEYRENVAKPAALWITKSDKTGKYYIHCTEEILLRLNLIVKNKFGFSLFRKDKDVEILEK